MTFMMKFAASLSVMLGLNLCLGARAVSGLSPPRGHPPRGHPPRGDESLLRDCTQHLWEFVQVRAGPGNTPS